MAGQVPGTERQHVKAALLASSHSQVGGFEVDPYRPFQQLEALQLTDRVVHATGEVMDALDLHLHLHIGSRVMEDISAERVLCDVLLGGGRVVHLRVGGGGSCVRLPVVGCEDVVLVSPWAATTAESESWSQWAICAWQGYKRLQGRLGGAWRLSKWKAYSSDPFKGSCQSIDFGYSRMPGGSVLQSRAREAGAAYELKSMRDAEGRCFFQEMIVPWLQQAWKRVEAESSQAALLMMEQTTCAAQLAGTGFTKVTVAANNPTPLHVDGNNVGLTVVCSFDVSGSTQLVGGSHIIVDAGNDFAVLVEDAPDGVHVVGPYGKLLHCNLATLSGCRLVLAAYASLDVHGVQKTMF